MSRSVTLEEVARAALLAGAAEDAAGRVRKRTESIDRLSKRRLAVWRAELPPSINAEHPRPAVRGECPPPGEPCPHVSCRYHLAIDVAPSTGNLIYNWPDRDVDASPYRCTLDEADRGGLTLEEVADRLNLTKERVRQIEMRALAKLFPAAVERHLGEHLQGSDVVGGALPTRRDVRVLPQPPQQADVPAGPSASGSRRADRPGAHETPRNPAAPQRAGNVHLNGRSGQLRSA